MTELILKDETFSVVGAAMEVYYKLGPGFYEPVYHQALAVEFDQRGIPFESEKRFKIVYKDVVLEKEYCADFLCFGQIIVELKALNQLSPIDWSQVLNYLKVSKTRVGLLFNFGSNAKLEWKKLVI